VPVGEPHAILAEKKVLVIDAVFVVPTPVEITMQLGAVTTKMARAVDRSSLTPVDIFDGGAVTPTPLSLHIHIIGVDPIISGDRMSF